MGGVTIEKGVKVGSGVAVGLGVEDGWTVAEGCGVKVGTSRGSVAVGVTEAVEVGGRMSGLNGFTAVCGLAKIAMNQKKIQAIPVMISQVRKLNRLSLLPRSMPK